ncbi:MAG: hypothetical protein QM783_01600 [Phycisphaerales bacterium]
MGVVSDAQPPDGFDALLKRFSGEVVDYQFFAFAGDESGGPPSIDTLRLVAQRTIELVAERYCPPGKRRGTESITEFYGIDVVRLSGHTPRLVGWDEFLGPEWSGPEPSVIGDHLTYRRAFKYPPYHYKVAKLPPPASRGWKDFLLGPKPPPFEAESTAECKRLSIMLLEMAIGEKIGSDQVMIWEWPTDWAHWFEAGHEWWGAACWTIWTRPDRFVGIVASATD